MSGVEIAGWTVAGIAFCGALALFHDWMNRPSPLRAFRIVREERLERPLALLELADIWEELSIEERLLIFLEQQKQEKVGGQYGHAIRDVAYYVLDGHPLPTHEEMA